MTTPPTGRHVFDDNATYQIQVQGKLDAAQSDRLGGLAISVGTTDAGDPMATLCGELVDQAALAGVLSHLYALRLTVLSVVRLDGASS